MPSISLNLVLKHKKENKMKHYTTIEQSKKLVKLGLNPNTADMCYIQHFDEYYNEVTFIEENPVLTYTIDVLDLPCWSLGALINLMPSMIYKGKQTFDLEIHKGVLYHVCYENHCHLDEIWVSKENLIDAAFEMIVWLLENGHINEENKNGL